MKRPDAFAAMLAALRALYDAEIIRLADEYRLRILAGEFSGGEEKGDGPYFLRLEREFAERHPWLATQPGRLAVEACSSWLLVGKERVSTDPATGEVLVDGYEHEAGDSAAEGMAHDVLAEAARRGWVRRARYGDESYALRVAS